MKEMPNRHLNEADAFNIGEPPPQDGLSESLGNTSLDGIQTN